jgi:protein phosphatase
MQVHEAQPGDTLLMCSDGLTTMVPDPDIQSILSNGGGEVEGTARALVDAANKAGGEDNITVIVLKFAE